MKELQAARKTILLSRHTRAKFRRLHPIEGMVNEQAEEWFRANAQACEHVCKETVAEVNALMERDDEHVCWHMIQAFEEDGDEPSLQAPATHAPFRTRLLLGAPTEACAVPHAL
eukprot:2201677-Prymnesium_polylepis.1